MWGEGRVQGALTDHVPERRQLPPGKRAGCEGASVEGHTKVPSACIMAGSAGLQTHPRSWVRPYTTAAAALVVCLLLYLPTWSLCCKILLIIGSNESGS